MIQDSNLYGTWRKALKYEKEDKYVLLSMLCSTLVVWSVLLYKKRFNSIILYNDSLKYVEIAKTFYFNTKINTLKSKEGKIPYQTTILPLTPIILKIFGFITFNHFNIASSIYIIVTSLLSSYFFKKFLDKYQLVSNPVITSCLLSIFPIRYVAYHSVLSCDSLNMIFVFLALIAVKLRSTKCLFVFVFLDLITSDFGIIFTISLIIYYFFAKYYKTTVALIQIFALAEIFLFFIFYITVGDPFAYFKSKYFYSSDFNMIPFKTIIINALSIATLEEFHIQYHFFIPITIGIAFIQYDSILIAIITGLSLIYVSMMNFTDIFRTGIIAEIFGILIGFDSFISSPKFQKVLPYFVVLYCLPVYYFNIKNIIYS